MRLSEDQKANAKAAGRTELEHRWNLAASKAGFIGSEYVNEPEYIFNIVHERLLELHDAKKVIFKFRNTKGETDHG